MRTIKLLLVLAPFAVAAACGGKKPEMAEPAVPSTPDMSLDAGGLSNPMDSGSTTTATPEVDAAPATTATAPTPPPVDTATAAAPVDAGPPADAGKPAKGGKGGGKGPKPPKK